MFREPDPRPHATERPELSRGSRGGGQTDERPAGGDSRDVFTRDLDLPRGSDRDRRWTAEGPVTLNGFEARALATIGAFRVVAASDLRDQQGRAWGANTGELRHLQRTGLVETRPFVVGRDRTAIVTLTERGRRVLEDSRHDTGNSRTQTFYAGFLKPRELSHDVQIYRAFVRAADRLTRQGACIRRVVLDFELKREYQRFRQRGRARAKDPADPGHVVADEVAAWARQHELPMVDDRVQFPDVRVEYDQPDGRHAIEDLEVMTPHYRGALAAAKGAAGFTRYRGVAARIGGISGGSRGRGASPRLAEEVLG